MTTPASFPIASLETKEHFIPEPAITSKENEVKISHPSPLLPVYKAIFFKGGRGEVPRSNHKDLCSPLPRFTHHQHHPLNGAPGPRRARIAWKRQKRGISFFFSPKMMTTDAFKRLSGAGWTCPFWWASQQPLSHDIPPGHHFPLRHDVAGSMLPVSPALKMHCTSWSKRWLQKQNQQRL